MDIIYAITPLIAAWMLDRILGDPAWLPHPVVLFGKMISFAEHHLNHGNRKRLKGALTAVCLILTVYAATLAIVDLLTPYPVAKACVETVLIFYCLAGTTLRREVKGVFDALQVSLDHGRLQVGRIVGRDTGRLSRHEIQTAALETLAENLSDGVIAPLFWYLLLGVPGMMAYKMVNTIDSMTGYRNARYADFGMTGARIDDFANYVPARVTAVLMVLASGNPRLFAFVRRFGNCHASPNSGWPESALAGALDCRFGGPHDYFGERVDKPYIGTNPRELTDADARRSLFICERAEVMGLLLTVALSILFHLLF